MEIFNFKYAVGDIIGSKFISLMVNEYLTSFSLILLFIIIYGTKGNEGILYWLYSLILILFVPIMPLALASIIVMLFMKYTNIKGRKDLLRIIGYFLLLITLFTFQFKIQSITQNAIIEGEDFFLKMATDSNLLVRKLGLSFPPSMCGVLFLSSYYSIIGLLNLILFVRASIIVFLVMVYLSEKLFFDGLVGNLEVSISRGSSKVRASDYNKKIPSFLSLGLKEIRLLIRTPVYLLNPIGGVVIVPIISAYGFYIILKKLLKDNLNYWSSVLYVLKSELAMNDQFAFLIIIYNFFLFFQ